MVSLVHTQAGWPDDWDALATSLRSRGWRGYFCDGSEVVMSEPVSSALSSALDGIRQPGKDGEPVP